MHISGSSLETLMNASCGLEGSLCIQFVWGCARGMRLGMVPSPSRFPSPVSWSTLTSHLQLSPSRPFCRQAHRRTRRLNETIPVVDVLAREPTTTLLPLNIHLAPNLLSLSLSFFSSNNTHTLSQLPLLLHSILS